MAKSSLQNDMLARIEKLEKQMKSKDDELRNLRSEIRNTKKHFDEELANKNLTIAELSSKIDALSQQLHDKPAASSDSHLYEIEPESEPVHSTDQPPKIEQDLLIIGDSLLRDLDANVINPGGDTTITCLPGARPRDVLNKFRKMAATHRFKRVIVHVGSNLIPKFAPDICSTRIIDCMESIRELAPDSKLSFSTVLPKLGDHLINGINKVNFDVFKSGKIGPSRTRFGHVPHNAYFTTARGEVNCDLFKRDGIHLSDKGRAAFAKSLYELVKL